jgi:hypothetical protein
MSYVGPPVCPYCQLDAELIDSAAVYRKSYGKLWICQPCQAWVGVLATSKSNRPKGTLAKAPLRQLRVQAHAAFDPFWKERWAQVGGSKSKARKHYYNELAIELRIDHDICHIGMFDEDRCRAVLKICAGWKKAAADAVEEPPSD